MKINYDCVRDVLLYLESRPAYDHNHQAIYQIFEFGKLPNHLLINYSEDDIMYSLSQLMQSCMINAKDRSTMSGPCIFYSGISPSGHELLSNIQNENIWTKVKETAKSIGGVSLPILSALATSVISKNLGL